MLITQAFQWIAPFSGWFLFIPPLAFVVFILLHFWWAKKVGKENDIDYLGFFGVLALISIVLTVLVPIFWGLHGTPTHTEMLEDDVESQFNITYVDVYWERRNDESKVEIRGKDTDGKYVICDIEDTRSEDTFKLVCDNGKDNWKGPQ